MSFSEEISPIMDPRSRVSRELAYPALKCSIDSVCNSLNTYISRKTSRFLQQWKQAALISSRSEELQISNCMVLTQHRLKIVAASMELISKRLRHRVLLEVLAAAEIIEGKRAISESGARIVNAKAHELECLNAAEIEASLRLIEIKKAYEGMMWREEEFKENMIGLANEDRVGFKRLRLEHDSVLERIQGMKEENAELQDRLVNYELSFNAYIQETERILEKNKNGVKVSPIKARVF